VLDVQYYNRVTFCHFYLVVLYSMSRCIDVSETTHIGQIVNHL